MTIVTAVRTNNSQGCVRRHQHLPLAANISIAAEPFLEPRSSDKGGKRKGCFGKSINAWDVVVVHLKANTSSIKQTWRTGPFHQRAAWISYWVHL